MVPEGWTEEALGDVLERIVEPVKVDPSKQYRQIGIRSHGKGLFHKKAVSGEALGNKRVFYIQKDCLVVNIVFAWEQAVAKTTDMETGMIASHRFPIYKPRHGKCDIDYVLYFFKSPLGKHFLDLASPGGAGRNKTLGQKEFSRLKLPLPPLKEQERITKILSTWDKAIHTTKLLLSQAKEQKKGLAQQLLTGRQRVPGFDRDWEEHSLSDLCEINPKRVPRPTDGKVSFISMQDVSEDAQIVNSKVVDFSSVSKGFTSFQDGDVLLAKITPCFENGKGGFARRLVNGVGFGSTEFHVLRAKTGVCPRFIYHVTNTSEFRIRGEANMQGSAGQKRVASDYLRNLKVIVPCLSEQARIASILDAADSEVRNLKDYLDRLKIEKKALMQQLLTGKRRVRVEEEQATA